VKLLVQDPVQVGLDVGKMLSNECILDLEEASVVNCFVVGLLECSAMRAFIVHLFEFVFAVFADNVSHVV